MSNRRRGRRYFAQSKTAVCDFCIGPDVKWEYLTHTFSLPAVDDLAEYHDSGDWACCDACMHDIEAQRYERMAARLQLNMIKDLQPGEAIDTSSMRWASRLLQAFIANRIAGPLPEDERANRRD